MASSDTPHVRYLNPMHHAERAPMEFATEGIWTQVKQTTQQLQRPVVLLHLCALLSLHGVPPPRGDRDSDWDRDTASRQRQGDADTLQFRNALAVGTGRLGNGVEEKQTRTSPRVPFFPH